MRCRLRKIVNAAGPVSVLGGGAPGAAATAAALAILPHAVEIVQLQATASRSIAQAFGYEAGTQPGRAAAARTKSLKQAWRARAAARKLAISLRRVIGESCLPRYFFLRRLVDVLLEVGEREPGQVERLAQRPREVAQVHHRGGQAVGLHCAALRALPVTLSQRPQRDLLAPLAFSSGGLTASTRPSARTKSVISRLGQGSRPRANRPSSSSVRARTPGRSARSPCRR